MGGVRGDGCIKVIDCTFQCSSGPPIDLSDVLIPGGLEVLIKGEHFTGPLCFGIPLISALLEMRGSVRLGPCPHCEFLCVYRGDELMPHDLNECTVAQIMRI